MKLPATPLENGIRLAVRLQPRASRNGVDGLFEGKDLRLKIRLTAPPVENAANQACREFLAELFRLPKQKVELVGGEKSKDKLFFLAGDPARLLEQLEGML